MVYDDLLDQNLFIAGQYAPPGKYRRIDSGLIISLDREDVLPASLDGTVASYALIKDTWRVIGAGKPIEMSTNSAKG